MSVMLDDAIDVRTIELWFSYDPTIVTSLGGQPGQLFADSGCPLFPVFDEDEPGAWYGGCVTMGPDLFRDGSRRTVPLEFRGPRGRNLPRPGGQRGSLRSSCRGHRGRLACRDDDPRRHHVLGRNATRPAAHPVLWRPTHSIPAPPISFGGRRTKTSRSRSSIWPAAALPHSVEGMLGTRTGRRAVGRHRPAGTHLFPAARTCSGSCGQENRQVTRKGILLK